MPAEAGMTWMEVGEVSPCFDRLGTNGLLQRLPYRTSSTSSSLRVGLPERLSRTNLMWRRMM